MVSEHLTRQAAADEPDTGADLIKIVGLEAEHANRLAKAGVHDYLDLAERSSDELAAVARVTAVTADSWRKQAADLIASQADATGDGHRYESYLWRLRVDDHGTIHETSIQHVGTGEVKHWSTWNTADMLMFITSQVSRVAAAPVRTTLGRSDMSIDQLVQQPAAAVQFDTPTAFAGQGLGIALALDFGRSDGLPHICGYDLVIVVRQLDGDVHKVIARENGMLEVGQSSIKVKAGGLPAGIYRLDAAVTLNKPSIGFRGRTALVEGVLLTVLPR